MLAAAEVARRAADAASSEADRLAARAEALANAAERADPASDGAIELYDAAAAAARASVAASERRSELEAAAAAAALKAAQAGLASSEIIPAGAPKPAEAQPAPAADSADSAPARPLPSRLFDRDVFGVGRKPRMPVLAPAPSADTLGAAPRPTAPSAAPAHALLPRTSSSSLSAASTLMPGSALAPALAPPAPASASIPAAPPALAPPASAALPASASQQLPPPDLLRNHVLAGQPADPPTVTCVWLAEPLVPYLISNHCARLAALRQQVGAAVFCYHSEDRLAKARGADGRSFRRVYVGQPGSKIGHPVPLPPAHFEQVVEHLTAVAAEARAARLGDGRRRRAAEGGNQAAAATAEAAHEGANGGEGQAARVGGGGATCEEEDGSAEPLSAGLSALALGAAEEGHARSAASTAGPRPRTGARQPQPPRAQQRHQQQRWSQLPRGGAQAGGFLPHHGPPHMFIPQPHHQYQQPFIYPPLPHGPHPDWYAAAQQQHYAMLMHQQWYAHPQAGELPPMFYYHQ